MNYKYEPLISQGYEYDPLAGYKSPITVTYEKTSEKVEENIMEAVHKVGINIDKPRLQSILERDNPHKVIIIDGEPHCSNCRKTIHNMFDYKFCSKCGCRIDWTRITIEGKSDL